MARIQDGCHHQVEWEWMSEVFFVQNGWIQYGRIQDGWHHQIEWEWMSLSQIFLVRVLCKMAESKMAEFKMAAIIKLSENEWVKVRLNYVWVRGRVEWECFWVNLREDNKVSESKMSQCLNPTWQSSRWLQSSSRVRMNEWSFFVQNGWIQDGRIQDGWHHQVEWQWMSEVFFQFKMAESKMAEFKMADIIKLSWMSLSQIELVWVRVVQNGWIKDGRIQEWISLNQSGVFLSEYLREDNKVSESKMAVSESKMADSRWLPSSSWVENEWVWVRF